MENTISRLLLGKRYHWLARYTSGDSLPMQNPDGSFNSYEDIDRENLTAFELWEVFSDFSKTRIFSLRFVKGQRLIWRRKTILSPASKIIGCFHIVGKQTTINGKNRQAIAVVDERDGSFDLIDKFVDNHVIYGKPALTEGEEWYEI